MPGTDPLSLSHAETITLRWWLRIPWDYPMMGFAFAYWLVFGTLLTLIGGPLHLILPKRQGERLGRFLLHQLFRKFTAALRLADLVHFDLSALDKLEKIDGPFIAAPNHTSLWDAVFIIARLPASVCVMKKQILLNPILGGGARLAGYIPNDGISRMIRDVEASLADGGQLLLFPEGTRTRSNVRWINPLKGGCGIIATRTKTPVYPIFIRSNTRYLQKGWPVWKRPVFPIHLQFDLGEPLVAGENESAQEFTARLAAIYEHELSKPHPLRRQIES